MLLFRVMKRVQQAETARARDPQASMCHTPRDSPPAREMNSMIVTEISWDAMFDGQPLPDSPARAAWCAAVAEVAAKAKAALPAEVNGHIEEAVQIVLNGDVDLLPDGAATVASQRNGTAESFVVNGSCSCPDFTIAPSGWCLHRLSAAIAKRAYPLAKAKLEAVVSTPESTLPAHEELQAL